MSDIMYYHKALQQPDAQQFANAVVKEVNGHVENKHWQLINIRSAKQDDIYGASNIILPYPSS
jgi:hypothetical protein